MRVLHLATIALVATIAGLLATGEAARACDPSLESCGPGAVVFPLTTSEGLRIGTVKALIHRGPVLEISRSTGQPQTVLYNNPSREPCSVDPDLYLMALPHARPSRTRAVYPVGY